MSCIVYQNSDATVAVVADFLRLKFTPTLPMPTPTPATPAPTPAPIADARRRLTEMPLRVGQWPQAEEAFTNQVIAHFSAGVLPNCDNGATLRSLLAGLLHCSPVRITKKFQGSGAIGRSPFWRRDNLLEPARVELYQLERDFYESIGLAVDGGAAPAPAPAPPPTHRYGTRARRTALAPAAAPTPAKPPAAPTPAAPTPAEPTPDDGPMPGPPANDDHMDLRAQVDNLYAQVDTLRAQLDDLIINDYGAYTHVRNTFSDMFAGVERRYDEYAAL